MLGRSRLIWTLSLLGLFAHPAAAYAAPGDPAPGSPPGAVYELPFERGRANAAPKGDGTGAMGAGEGGSHYRSENNFGSSSHVPGEPGEANAGEAGGAGGSGGSQGSGSAAGGGNGAQPGATPDGGAAAVQTVDTGNTSLAATLALLAAIGLVALAVGGLAARANRLSSR